MPNLNEKGHEILDQTPLALPVRIQRSIGIDRQNQYMVQYDTQEDFESPEEADDFDCGDDFDASIPWEKDSPYEEDNRNMILQAARKEFDSKFGSQYSKRSKAPEEPTDDSPKTYPSDSAEGKKTKTTLTKTARIKSSVPEDLEDD